MMKGGGRLAAGGKRQTKALEKQVLSFLLLLMEDESVKTAERLKAAELIFRLLEKEENRTERKKEEGRRKETAEEMRGQSVVIIDDLTG